MAGQEHSENSLHDLSVVIPTLNAAPWLGTTIAGLAGAREIIVADGGSADGTVKQARVLGARTVETPRGRGAQMTAGVARADGAWLLLLHADTRLQPGWREAASHHMRGLPGKAGYFRLAFDSDSREARRLERIVAWRCRALGLPYGDQGLLISRAFLDSVGGIGNLPLMEDVDLARRIGRRNLVALDAVALTSAARYVRGGWRRRSARNLLCLTLYFMGVPPHRIARLYG